MAVAGLEIVSRIPYEDGLAFGEAGTYERIDGRLEFAVDPTLPANAVIVDLDRAERGADGLVYFHAGFTLLQPREPTRGSGNLLYSVANRGRRGIGVNRPAAAAMPSERIDPGDGFLLRRGWTLAWSGWQWDVPHTPALLGFEPPRALDATGRPLRGEVMVQFQPDERVRDQQLSDRGHLPYPAADVDDADARLLVRDWLDGPATEI